MENKYKERAGELLLLHTNKYSNISMPSEMDSKIINAMCQLAEEIEKVYKEVMPNDLQQYLAKERYEKALNSLKNQEICIEDSTITYRVNDLLKALKISAGLKEVAVCECDTPYFPTGNIHFCSKCNKSTAY